MKLKYLSIIAVVALPYTQANALSIYNTPEEKLNVNLEMGVGIFSSEKSYSTLGIKVDDHSSTWQEAYIKTGISGEKKFENTTSFYGNINAVASVTLGDGDAAGFSLGSEREIDFDEMYIGWRSGNLFPFFGDDGIDFSIGSQPFVLGDGFIISNDALAFGDNSFEFDRGGAYYLAPKRAFDKTAILKLGGKKGIKSDIFWLKSNNPAQDKMEISGANIEFVGANNKYAISYIKGLDAENFLYNRDGQENISLRYNSTMGIENLTLSAEHVTQKSKLSDNKNAWYVEGGWRFKNISYTPTLNYRYSSFDKGYDPLFYGYTRAGTWFQGEVAANYAGPFNTNTDIHHFGVKASLSEKVTLGALYYKFIDHEKVSNFNRSGQETDLYLQYFANDHFFINPVIGFFKPEVSAFEGGTQNGTNSTNIYAQLILVASF